jgi:hypothetical protein
MVNEKFLYNPVVQIKDHSILLTFAFREQVLPHSVMSSCEKTYILKEGVDGNGKNFQ